MTTPRRDAWTVGAYLTHRFNPELGIGRIVSADRRTIVVDFPRLNTQLRLATSTDALVSVDLGPGRPVRLSATSEETTIVARAPDGRLTLANGQTVGLHELWPLTLEGALFERLALGELDDVEDFLARLGVLQLQSYREANGLGSFLGGRVRLFPHQLYVAERATASTPVRWLLADEVGLGKTIEAALILNRLVHTGQVQRCLVIAPESLTVQWLGELWRKYHQVFTLLDSARLGDVARDFGAGFNPFELHPRSVIALETLVERPNLTDQAVRAGIDLLVVDEAQRLRRPPGHPGEPAWRAVAPIAALGRHVLLLSATPLEDDAHGFFRLLQLLRPSDFPESTGFDKRLAMGTPLPPCTSSTRRVDIGGLPPRVGVPIAIKEDRHWHSRQALEQAIRSLDAPHAVARRHKVDRIHRMLSSGAALRSLLGPDEVALRRQADEVDRSDPRLEWLLTHAPRWRSAGEKTLIFVSHRDTLELVRTTLSHRAQLASGAFHEDMTAAKRDTEVARFREFDGPSLLVSTECGGEGRNFEFCTRLVLFDLPWQPSVVEQRIGRLDRIGRSLPVTIVYFAPPDGIGRDVVRLFEGLGLFREPLAGAEPQLAHVSAALEDVAVDAHASLTDAHLDALLAEARSTRSRIREAAYRELHRDPYRASMAPAILARVPHDLDALTEQVVVTACERLGFKIDRLRGHRTYSIEIGNEALVDSLPGVTAGSGFIGTFDREEAVARENIDFFASGHPLIEGLFGHIHEASLGRVVRIELTVGTGHDHGLLAIYKEGHGFEVIAVDASGALRPDWAAALRWHPAPIDRVVEEQKGHDWEALVRRLAPKLDPGRRPHAVGALVVRPAPTSR